MKTKTPPQSTGRLRGLRALASLALLLPLSANADWHQGTVTQLGVGYDGSTITFIVSDWVRTNCTCYSPWPSMMCLDRDRTSHPEEYAMLLKARGRNSPVGAYIDEATCKVLAMYEIN